MNDKKRSVELVVLLVLILASISSRVTFQVAAQGTRRAVPVVIDAPKPALQANVDGEVKPFKLMRSGLKASIFAHPIPQVWLVFPASGQNASEITITLPSDARKSLLDCWRAELEYRYKKAFEFGSIEKRIEDDYALGRVNMSVLSKLESIDINTPTGIRKISGDEVGAIIGFLARSAQNVVEQAKEYKRPKSIA